MWPSIPSPEIQWLKFQIFGSHWLQATPLLAARGFFLLSSCSSTWQGEKCHVYGWFFFDWLSHSFFESIHKEVKIKEFSFVPSGLIKLKERR